MYSVSCSHSVRRRGSLCLFDKTRSLANMKSSLYPSRGGGKSFVKGIKGNVLTLLHKLSLIYLPFLHLKLITHHIPPYPSLLSSTTTCITATNHTCLPLKPHQYPANSHPTTHPRPIPINKTPYQQAFTSSRFPAMNTEEHVSPTPSSHHSCKTLSFPNETRGLRGVSGVSGARK